MNLPQSSRRDAQKITAMIPIKPLSVNEAWLGRRFKSYKYEEYEKAMLWELKKVKRRDKGKKVGITIVFSLKSPLRSDLDNYVKPFLDCLVKSEIIQDDRYIFELHIFKKQSKKEGVEFGIYGVDN